MELSPADNCEDAQWKILSRLNYLASTPNHTILLLQKESQNMCIKLKGVVETTNGSVTKLQQSMQNMNKVCIPILQDACEQLSKIHLVNLAGRIQHVEKYRMQMEQVLLKRIQWLEIRVEEYLHLNDEMNNYGSNSCKMCKLNMDYQRLQFVKDGIEHSHMFKQNKFEPEQLIKDDEENDEDAMNLISKMLSRKNEILSTEASNLTFFLTEALNSISAPLKLPVKVMSSEELMQMAHSSNTVVNTAFKALSENFIVWTKKQLTPILLTIFKRYNRQQKLKDQQKMLSQETQTMENNPIMSNKSFELRIDALRREVNSRKAQIEALIEQITKVRVGAQKTKEMLQVTIADNQVKITDLQFSLKGRDDIIIKLELNLSQTSQKLSQLRINPNLSKSMQVQQQLTTNNGASQSRPITKKNLRQLRTSTKYENKFASHALNRSNEGMERIKEQVNREAQPLKRSGSIPKTKISELQDQSLKNSQLMTAAATESLTPILQRDSELMTQASKKKLAVAIDTGTELTRKSSIENMVYWMKHLPLEPDSPIIEEIHQVNNILSSKLGSKINELHGEKQVNNKRRINNVQMQTLSIPLSSTEDNHQQTNIINAGENQEAQTKPLQSNWNKQSMNQQLRNPITIIKDSKSAPNRQQLETTTHLFRELPQSSNVLRDTSSFKNKAKLSKHTLDRQPQLLRISSKRLTNSSVKHTTLSDFTNIKLNKIQVAKPQNTKNEPYNTPRNNNITEFESIMDNEQTDKQNSQHIGEATHTKSKLLDSLFDASINEGSPINKANLDLAQDNSVSSHHLSKLAKSGFNFTNHSKKTAHKQKEKQSKQRLKQISHEEYGVDDLELFMGVAQAYRFQLVTCKRSLLKQTPIPSHELVGDHEQWITQFYSFLEKLRKTNHQSYANLKNFISHPYQTAVNKLYNSNNQESFKYGDFSDCIRRIIQLHRRCESYDSKNLCNHITDFLRRIGFQTGGLQSVMVRSLFPTLNS